MMYSFQQGGRGLRRQTDADDPGGALWIDLFRPHAEHAEVVSALGIDVPSLADMEEIEISNRLYRDEGADVMTVVLPGQTPEGGHIAGPVSFILSQERLVTVRHHSPRAFDTFPDRADRSAAGCGTADRVCLGLLEEIVARQADLLEGVGRALDGVSGRVLGGGGRKPEALQTALEEIGHQGEMINRVRLALLTMERALSFFGQTLGGRHQTDDLREIVQAQVRDIQSLAVHADFLSTRLSLSVDATMGMINLAQNNTVRIVSVVTALFMPPTMIASIYGMNFAKMPELSWNAGYPLALALMAVTAFGTWAFFKWRHWL
jgi:magnesium transporter